jgi:non-specific serine/threonine protein kinase
LPPLSNTPNTFFRSPTLSFSSPPPGTPANDPPHAQPLRLGPGGRFELQPAEYRLLVDGHSANLGGRALDLLLVLASRPAELFSKNELLARVWPGLVVEEGNLRVQVNSLRRVLGEDAIATVPGRGYRLCLLPQQPSEAAPAALDAPVAKLTGELDGQWAGTAARELALFGREADLQRLQRQLTPGTCLTITGVAGVGKSSLARAALQRFKGRGIWVDLTPLAEAAPIPGAIARALGAQLEPAGAAAGTPAGGDDATGRLHAQQQAQLLALLAGQPTLLVLDNAEHLLAGCADWAARLCAAPDLQLLVTSQAPLGIAAERLLNLEPLALSSRDSASDGAALALLLDRIAATDRRFQPTAPKLPLLNALCRQLDGLPVALEMAATRVPLMGLQAVHDALAERFALLSRGRRDAASRHRTLLDALDWSYGLLEAAEQRLFRALGVCAGGFTLDLALALAGDEHTRHWDVVDGLATLVERSLVSMDGQDPPRYRLLESLRAYALDKLGAGALAQERHSCRQRHARALLALFSSSADEARRLAEMDNVREAFVWARQHDLALAAQLSARVTQVVVFTTWRQEVAEWMLSLREAMAAAPGQALPLAVQAGWWSGLAHILNVCRDRNALPAARQAVALWRRLADVEELQAALGHWVRAVGEVGPELDEACVALQASAATVPASPRAGLRVWGALAEAALLRQDYATLLACREQQLRCATELAMLPMMEAAETNVCVALLSLGRHAEAAERGSALLQRMDVAGSADNGNLPWALNVLADALIHLRDLTGARAIVQRMLAADARFGTAISWAAILELIVAEERPRTAARLLGHLQRRAEQRCDDEPGPGFAELLQRTRALVAQRLQAPLAAALDAEGRQLNAEQAAQLALAEGD